MSYITLVTCPICGSDAIARSKHTSVVPFFQAEMEPGFFVPVGVISIYWSCSACNALFQNPRMDDQQIAEYYATGIYRRNLNLTDEQMDMDEQQRAETDASIIKGKGLKPTRHLDIGSSRGYLLNCIGAQIKSGVEPTAGRCLFDGIVIFQDIASVDGKYDLITMIHVLEHEHDPVGYLRQVVSKLSDNGRLIIEVPSWRSKGGPLRLAHLYHFEPTNLRYILDEVGMRAEYADENPHLFVIARKA